MIEKPKKKLPDGTLVDVDILAAEATKAEKDINGKPLAGRIVSVGSVMNEDGYDDLLFYFENGERLVVSIANVMSSTFSVRSNESNKATHDAKDNVIHQTYLPLTGGTITGKINLEDNLTFTKAGFENSAYLKSSDDATKILYKPLGEREEAELATLEDVDEKLDKTGGEVNGSLTVLPGNSVQVDTIYNYDVRTRILLDNEGIYYDKTLEGKKSSNEIVTKADLEALKQEILSLIGQGE